VKAGGQALTDYERWLERRALAPRTCASYRRWVGDLVSHLDAGGELEAFLAPERDHDRRALLGDWRRRLGVATSSARNPTLSVCRHWDASERGGMRARAGLELSAHRLRHTCLTGLVRRGNDLVMVAELAGHQKLDTTRRYTLPSAADRQAAVEGLQIDY
jgi:integrase